MRSAVAAVATPAPSRESCCSSSSSGCKWLDKLLQGDSFGPTEWQQLEHHEKMHAPELGVTMNDEAAAKQSPRMVRFTGMVQDMLDTEYFGTAPASSPLGEWEISNHTHPLRERSLLVLVPPPQGNSCIAINQQQESQREPKRPKLLLNSMKDNEDDPDAMETCPENHATVVGPLLAKFYYDQYYYDPTSSSKHQQQHQQRLKMNEMVEILAFMEEEEEETIPATRSWDGATSSFLDAVVLPRRILHVIWYSKLNDAENLTSRPLSLTTTTGEKSIGSNDIHLSQLATTFQVDETSMAAIWMVLHSKAERKTPETNEAIVTPQNTLLGSASLNIVFNQTSEKTTNTTTAFLSALQSLVSNVHFVSITPHTLEESVLAPSKIAGRLQQTSLQLPAGSVVVLDVRGLVPGKLSARQLQNLRDLQELCASHRLSYTFDGGIRIPFEADYRIIVISDARTHKLLSCHLTVQNTFTLGSVGTDETSRNISMQMDATIHAARERLSSNRQRVGNIQLSPSVLERAQQDFLQRRPHVGETDFHRWLTLTRLHARCRQSNMAEIMDWEQALKLDDQMKVSLQSRK